MDMVTLQLFKAMQTVWFENGLNVKMSLYKVLCTGNQEGMSEMVTNA
jgi:phosphatidylinositol kinase/protein kinase (PI-3  family)